MRASVYTYRYSCLLPAAITEVARSCVPFPSLHLRQDRLVVRRPPPCGGLVMGAPADHAIPPPRAFNHRHLGVSPNEAGADLSARGPERHGDARHTHTMHARTSTWAQSTGIHPSRLEQRKRGLKRPFMCSSSAHSTWRGGGALGR